MDPISLIMVGMIGLLIIFMFRNSRKRREMMEKLQTGAVPGADVMLTSGVYATIESIDEADENRVTVSSGTSTLVIHRSAIANILTPVEEDNFEQQNTLAPDDDPNFDGSINPSDDSSDSDEEDRDPKQS